MAYMQDKRERREMGAEYNMNSQVIGVEGLKAGGCKKDLAKRVHYRS